MQTSTLGIIADLDLRVRQLAQFFNGFYIGCAHVGGGNNTQFTAVLRKFPQLVHQKTQTAPFDKGYQHINTICRHDLFLQLRVHLRLMDSTGEQRALSNRGFRAAEISGCFANSKSRIGLPQKSKKLLCALVNAQRGKVSFSSCILNEVNDLVGQSDLGRDIPTVISYVVQAFLNYISQILCQHFRCFRLINGRNSLAGFRNLRKLAV